VLLIVALAATGPTAARGADPKPKDVPAAPITVQVNVTTKSHRSNRCTHTKDEKCVGCQDDNTITMIATGAVKRSERDPLFFEVISMKAHIRYGRHWSCPIDGERDIESADKDVHVVSVQIAATQLGGASVTDGVLSLIQIPMMGNDLELMGLPMPRGGGAAANMALFNWHLALLVPYKTVRRSWPDGENDQWLNIRIYSDIIRKGTGPSLGQQGFNFTSNPDGKVDLLAWNAQKAQGGRSVNFNDSDPKTDAKWSADVGWRIGAATRQVFITDPETDHNYVFGETYEPGKLEMLPEATTGSKVNDRSIEPWSIDPIAGSELKIVTFPGGAKPAKGPGAKITFDKMPARNDAFGRKTIKAEDGSVTVKVFFDKTATDNPDGSVPNWFYYWKQGAVPRLEEFHYVKRGDIFGQFVKPDRLEICDLAGGPEKAYQIQLYQTTRGAHVARPKGPGYYQDRGMVKPWQILSFPHKTSIEACHGTVLHEIRHKELYQWLASPEAVDTDGDGVPDWAEEALEWGLDPLNPDTHFLKDQLGGEYASYGDDELLARIRELDFAPNKDQDWAAPGSQTDPPEK
jgi:hypothetical protein